MRINEKARKPKTIVWLSHRILFAMCFVFAANAQAQGNFCTQTAQSLLSACKAEASDDAFVKKAICNNYSDSAERAECFAELTQERNEKLQFCQEQRAWRVDNCQAVGEGRYDPEIDPAEFEQDYKNLTKPNPYFPLAVGNKWTFRSLTDNELNTVEILDQTKLIEGVTCVVARDKVFKDGFLVENTDDWFCQNMDRTVWYFGEEVKDFEVFDGDKPKRPELVSIDGSFKAGRDGDKPGIIFLPAPKTGDVYFEEFSLGNAEDATEILSTNYSFGTNPDLDQLVPQQLAERFCKNDCIVTKNYSLLEPGIEARKYYARGIGFFIEIGLEEQAVLQMINCNFDSRCEGLPNP